MFGSDVTRAAAETVDPRVARSQSTILSRVASGQGTPLAIARSQRIAANIDREVARRQAIFDKRGGDVDPRFAQALEALKARQTAFRSAFDSQQQIAARAGGPAGGAGGPAVGGPVGGGVPAPGAPAGAGVPAGGGGVAGPDVAMQNLANALNGIRDGINLNIGEVNVTITNTGELANSIKQAVIDAIGGGVNDNSLTTNETSLLNTTSTT
ncbi:MAG: hypothetical protein ACYTA3_05660 [Planctomycetota bacterium]|jgi:hypothetical protein